MMKFGSVTKKIIKGGVIMRKEFMDLYVSYRNHGMSRDDAYSTAYTVLREKYGEENINRELEIQ